MKIVRIVLDKTVAAGKLVVETDPLPSKEIAEAFEDLVKGHPTWGTANFSVRLLDGLLVINGLHPGIKGDILNKKLDEAELLIQRAAREHAEREEQKLAAKIAEATRLAQQLGLPIY